MLWDSSFHSTAQQGGRSNLVGLVGPPQPSLPPGKAREATGITPSLPGEANTATFFASRSPFAAKAAYPINQVREEGGVERVVP